MSFKTGPDVVLLRSADDPDPYLRAFRENGLRAECRPVLRFEFPDKQVLRQYVTPVSRYGGIIATSPRAARALQYVFDDDGTLHAQWKGSAAYVVGPKTAARFRTLDFDVRGEETGDAATLASLIVETAPDVPLLFLSGNRRRDTLPDALRSAEISFEERVVYETHLRSDMELSDLERASWIVFFSPSGLEAVRKSGEENLDRYRCAAIGPTTAGSLRSQGLTVDAVAETPSPEGLVQAISAAAARG